MQKALLYAELLPNQKMADLQDAGDFTALMSLNEQMKVMPFGDVWDMFCEENGVLKEEDWFQDCMQYEKDVLSKRV
jgi:L-rhamnose isomerase